MSPSRRQRGARDLAQARGRSPATCPLLRLQTDTKLKSKQSPWPPTHSGLCHPRGPVPAGSHSFPIPRRSFQTGNGLYGASRSEALPRRGGTSPGTRAGSRRSAACAPRPPRRHPQRCAWPGRGWAGLAGAGMGPGAVRGRRARPSPAPKGRGGPACGRTGRRGRSRGPARRRRRRRAPPRRPPRFSAALPPPGRPLPAGALGPPGLALTERSPLRRPVPGGGWAARGPRSRPRGRAARGGRAGPGRADPIRAHHSTAGGPAPLLRAPGDWPTPARLGSRLVSAPVAHAHGGGRQVVRRLWRRSVSALRLCGRSHTAVPQTPHRRQWCGRRLLL